MAQSKFDIAYNFQSGSSTSRSLKEWAKEEYWAPLGCSKLPAPIACVVYGTAIAVNPKEAISLLQKSLNMVGEAHLDEFTAIPENGEMSPQVLKLMNEIAKIDLEFYIARYMVRTRSSGQRNTELLNYLAQLEMEMA